MKEEFLKCSHKYPNGESAIEYCDIYEMRSCDMYCKICGKEGTRKDLKEKQNHLKCEVKNIKEEILDNINNILNKYNDKLWYVKINGCEYGDPYEYDNNSYPWEIETVYYGDYDLVNKLIGLQYLSYKIEKFDIKKHRIFDIEDAQESFNKIYKPKMVGDVVEYEGDQYKVTGFNDDGGIWIKDMNGKDLHIDKNEAKKCKLVYSEYYNKNKK